MIFEEPYVKYTLGSNWILRTDPFFPSKKYSVYDITSMVTLTVSEACFTLLKIFSRKALSYNEINQIFIKNGICFDWDAFKVIYQQKKVSGILVKSDFPYSHLNPFIEDCDFSNSNISMPSSPFDIEMHLTHKCNLKCIHCFQESSPSSYKYNELDFKQWGVIFNQFEQNRIQNVTISGGEPLAYKGFSELFDELVKRKMNYSILTNGTLVDKTNINSLSASNVSLSISLDGHNEDVHDRIRGKGTFKRVVSAINSLVSNGANVNLSYTVNSHNYKYIKDIALLARKMGARGLVFGFTDAIGRAKENSYLVLTASQRRLAIDSFEKVKKELSSELYLDFADISFMKGNYSQLVYCSAGTTRLAVSAEGKIYPCIVALGNKELCMGDLIKENLKDIWKKKQEWHLFRGGIHIDEIDSCNKCSLQIHCTQKNCRLKSYAENRSLYNKPLECPKDFISNF